MTEQIITIEDLNAIYHKVYTMDDILNAIAKYYKCSTENLLNDNKRMWYFKAHTFFILCYFGITTASIGKHFGVTSSTVSQKSLAASAYFFTDKHSVGIFLFVLHELRQTNQNS